MFYRNSSWMILEDVTDLKVSLRVSKDVNFQNPIYPIYIGSKKLF